MTSDEMYYYVTLTHLLSLYDLSMGAVVRNSTVRMKQGTREGGTFSIMVGLWNTPISREACLTLDLLLCRSQVTMALLISSLIAEFFLGWVVFFIPCLSYFSHLLCVIMLNQGIIHRSSSE